MNTTTLIRRRLEKLEREPGILNSLAWIERTTVRPVSSEPAKVTAHEALRLWRTRLQTARAPHSGMPELIKQLEKLTPQRGVEQYTFDEPNSSATFVFTKTGGEFLGSIVVERKSA